MLEIADPRPGVRLLRLARPEARNALNHALAVADALEEARRSDAEGITAFV